MAKGMTADVYRDNCIAPDIAFMVQRALCWRPWDRAGFLTEISQYEELGDLCELGDLGDLDDRCDFGELDLVQDHAAPPNRSIATLLDDVEHKVKAQKQSPWSITTKEAALLLERRSSVVPCHPAANKLLDGLCYSFFVEAGSAALGKRKKSQAGSSGLAAADEAMVVTAEYSGVSGGSLFDLDDGSHLGVLRISGSNQQSLHLKFGKYCLVLLQKHPDYNMDEFEEGMPQIMKDLRFDDGESYWYPTSIRTDIGMVFPAGESVDAYKWCFAPVEKLTPSEKEDAVSENYDEKLDMANAKMYDRFMDASKHLNGMDWNELS